MGSVYSADQASDLKEIWYRTVVICDMVIEVLKDSVLSLNVKTAFNDEAEGCLASSSLFYSNGDLDSLLAIKEYAQKLFLKAEEHIASVQETVVIRAGSSPRAIY